MSAEDESPPSAVLPSGVDARHRALVEASMRLEERLADRPGAREELRERWGWLDTRERNALILELASHPSLRMLDMLRRVLRVLRPIDIELAHALAEMADRARRRHEAKRAIRLFLLVDAASHLAILEDDRLGWLCQKLGATARGRRIAVEWTRLRREAHHSSPAITMGPESQLLPEHLRHACDPELTAERAFWAGAARLAVLHFEVHGAHDHARNAPSCELWSLANEACVDHVRADAAHLLRASAPVDPESRALAREALRTVARESGGWEAIIAKAWQESLEDA